MNKRFAALDLGDRWTGVATADPAGIITTPHTTVETKNLFTFLQAFLKKEMIGVMVVGLPITLRLTESDQTKKIRVVFQELQEQFPNNTFVFFDERYSSQHAESIKPIQSKKDKLHSHAIAAAIILSDYLESIKNPDEQAFFPS